MSPALSLVLTSPRVAPGLLTRAAWRALEDADVVLTRALGEPLAAAVADAGVEVMALAEPEITVPALARVLVDRATEASVAWLVGPDGDPHLTDAVGIEVSRLEDPPEVEIVVGSWDVPGSRLLDAVAVMDRLRSPGGCPWDAEQTHASLVPYLLEEAHEVADTVDALPGADGMSALAGELGDVLLQVLFHSRVAEDEEDGFDIDDVAGRLVDKLVRRHPHVFADGTATSPGEVEQSWERIKAEERAAAGGDEDDLLHGIPASLPSLQAAQKVLTRLDRLGLPFPEVDDGLARDLLLLVARAREQGRDAEGELRRMVRRLGATP